MAKIILLIPDLFWDGFKQDFLVGMAILLVSGMAGMIASQMIFNSTTSKSIIETNNNLTGAITNASMEFKIAMATVKQQNEDQKLTCGYHRQQTEEISRRLGEIRLSVDHLYEVYGLNKFNKDA